MARMSAMVGVGIVAALLFATSCGGGGDGPNIPKFPPTGVTPEIGGYPIYAEDGSVTDVIYVEEDGGQLFMRYIRYRDKIENGAFEVAWGQIGGTHCPTDGFLLRGHFLSPIEVEGVLLREFACSVTDNVSFRTELSR